MKKIKNGEAVFVPLKFDKNLYLKIGADNKIHKLDNLSYLLIYTNKKNQKIIEWVTLIPETIYRNPGKDKFIGKIVIEDWFGNYKKGYYKNSAGKLFYLKVSDQNSDGLKISSSDIKTNSLICFSEPWYGENFSGDGESFIYIGGYDTFCFNTGNPYDDEDNYINPGDDLGGNHGETFPSDYITVIGNERIEPVSINLPLKMYQTDMLKYPTLTDIVANLDTYVASNPKLLEAISKFSYLSKESVLNNLKFGRGALIIITDSFDDDTYGEHFDGYIYLNAKYINHLESTSFNSEKYNAIRMFMTINILHEYVHWGNFQSMKRYPNEAGDQFECATFGGMVNFDINTGNLKIVRCF